MTPSDSHTKQSSVQTPHPFSNIPTLETKTGNGKTFAIIGIISGCIAFALFPPFFGILGIVFGIIGMKKGNKKFSWVAVGVSIAGLIVGMILGAFFYVNVQF